MFDPHFRFFLWLVLPVQRLRMFRDSFGMRALFANFDRSQRFCAKTPRHGSAANPKPEKETNHDYGWTMFLSEYIMGKR